MLLKETLLKALLPCYTAAEQEGGIWQELRQARHALGKITSPPGLPTGLVVLKEELLLLMTNFEEG